MDELIKIVEEGFESAKRSVLAKIKNHFKDGNHTSTETNMRLEFRNWIAQTILTGEEIEGEGGAPIVVALVDDFAGGVVQADGPEASSNIEIVLLKAKPEASNRTAEDFNAMIVPQVEGKKPILAGNVALQLQGGVVAVENIKIRHHASQIKPPEFMLGARVVGGDYRVKEARTEPFILKDYRAKYYKKCDNPALSDQVSRLVCIRRGGKINKRLQDSEVHTVEDFLIQLLINPQGLKSIVKCPEKKWEAIVNNARACLSGKKVYCYMDLKQNKGVAFNILGDVLGLCSGSCYSRTNTLLEEQKADAEELLKSAYQKWEQVKAFDDQNSLQQHLAGLSTCTGSNLCGGGASETVGESSSRRSHHPSFHSMASTASLFEETELRSFTSIDEMYDAVMQCDPSWPCSSTSSLFEDLVFGPNADEPQVVNRSNSPRRWKKLLCVSRWFSVRRRVALDVSSPNRKKPRVG